jgi:anti-anti-sigma regulatory factor/nucleotide-binding universal stress UspA family protein
MHEGVISLSGTITQNLWPVLSPAVKLQLKQHRAGIVLDCHGIRDFNAVGGETLLEAAHYVQEQHGKIILANAPGMVLDILRDTPHIAALMPLAWTVTEGRERLGLPMCGDCADTILVGMLGTPADGHAIALACQLLIQSSAPNNALNKANERVLHLAYLVKITHEMPLISPDGEHETIACESLEAVENYLHEQHISVRIRVERSRHPAQHLLDIACETQPNTLIIGLPQVASEEDHEFLTHVLDHATCEVLVHRIPLSVQKERGNS